MMPIGPLILEPIFIDFPFINGQVWRARKAGLDVGRVLSAFGFEDEEEGVAKDF